MCFKKNPKYWLLSMNYLAYILFSAFFFVTLQRFMGLWLSTGPDPKKISVYYA